MPSGDTPITQLVRISDVDGTFFTEVALLVVPRLGARLTFSQPGKPRVAYRVDEITARRSPGIVDILASRVSSDEAEPPSHPAAEVMRRFCERYAYQTRHGTELGGDLVFEQLMNYVRAGTLPENAE